MDRGTFKCENCGADYTPPLTDAPPTLFQGDPGTAGPVPIPPVQALTSPPPANPVAAPTPEPVTEDRDPVDAAPRASVAPPGSAEPSPGSAVQQTGDPSTPRTASPITQTDPLIAQPPTPSAGLTVQGIPRSFWVAVAILGSCLLLLTAAAVFSAGNETPSDPNEIGLAAPPQQGTAVEPGAAGGTLDVPGQTVGEQ